MVMRREEIVARVNRTLVDEFELSQDDLSAEKLLGEDLDLDSLDAVDMIAALEISFDIRIDEEEAKKIRTVGDIHDFVAKMLIGP